MPIYPLRKLDPSAESVELYDRWLGELQEALERLREGKDYLLCALMVTDILGKDTKMLVAGDPVPLERAFGHELEDGTLDLPGVMSRKKQVAPKVLGAL